MPSTSCAPARSSSVGRLLIGCSCTPSTVTNELRGCTVSRAGTSFASSHARIVASIAAVTPASRAPIVRATASSSRAGVGALRASLHIVSA